MNYKEIQALILELAHKNGYEVFRGIDGGGAFRFHKNGEQVASIYGSTSALEWLKDNIGRK